MSIIEELTKTCEMWRKNCETLTAERDALREQVEILRKLIDTQADELKQLRSKLEMAKDLIERLSHWDMLWTGKGQPSLVADGPYWKQQIDEASRKLEV